MSPRTEEAIRTATANVARGVVSSAVMLGVGAIAVVGGLWWMFGREREELGVFDHSVIAASWPSMTLKQRMSILRRIPGDRMSSGTKDLVAETSNWMSIAPGNQALIYAHADR